MAKLYFRYGAMNSGKSIDIIKVDFNYKERGQNTLILNSSLDTRYGINKVSSRIGAKIDAIGVSEDTNVLVLFIKENKKEKIDCVLVDEVQFFKKEQIYQLASIVDDFNVPVICYGLRSDFKLNCFEGSATLFAICDVIEEIKTICWCGKKATINTRVIDGKIVKEGEQIQIGGNESYISLCRKHYKEGKIK